jgi:hypothetical protein
MSLPMFGEFVYRLIEVNLKLLFKTDLMCIIVFLACFAGFLFFAGFTITLGYFRPFQPQK